MLAEDMCSKNQKVGYLIRAIHNKSLFDSESFVHFTKSPFLIKLLFIMSESSEKRYKNTSDRFN